jgi:hypothetical protein
LLSGSARQMGECPGYLEAGRRCWITANDAQNAQRLSWQAQTICKWLANRRGNGNGEFTTVKTDGSRLP